MDQPAHGLEFDWDPANVRHLARHRIAPAEAEAVFRNQPVIVDHRVVGGEERWTAVGVTNSLRVLVVVFTMRGMRIRPVTGWKADKRTQGIHFRGKE